MRKNDMCKHILGIFSPLRFFLLERTFYLHSVCLSVQQNSFLRVVLYFVQCFTIKTQFSTVFAILADVILIIKELHYHNRLQIKFELCPCSLFFSSELWWYIVLSLQNTDQVKILCRFMNFCWFMTLWFWTHAKKLPEKWDGYTNVWETL